MALPGVVFFRAVGAYVVNPDNEMFLLMVSLPADTYDLKILSPDLRQDDKPRLTAPSLSPKVLSSTALATTQLACVKQPLLEPLPSKSKVLLLLLLSDTAEDDGYFPVGEFSLSLHLRRYWLLGADTEVK